jgi:hypothetical protein
VAIELLLGTSGGSDGAFYPLVFFHVISALVGFGSIGFAGVYASRAAQVARSEQRAGDAVLVLDEVPPASLEAQPAKRAAPVADLAKGTDLPVGDAVRTPEPARRSPAGGPRHLLRVEGQGAAPEATAPPGAADPASAHVGPLLGPSNEDRAVDPELEELARYFARPARFWKAVLVVPVFGALALWVEPGGGGLDQVWDITAMLVWAGAALVAAGLVVPSLRQVRSVLLALGPAFGGPGNSVGAEAPPPAAREVKASHESERNVTVPLTHYEAAVRAKLARYGRLASRGAATCDVLFFVALALMIWKP